MRSDQFLEELISRLRWLALAAGRKYWRIRDHNLSFRPAPSQTTSELAGYLEIPEQNGVTLCS